MSKPEQDRRHAQLILNILMIFMLLINFVITEPRIAHTHTQGKLIPINIIE